MFLTGDDSRAWKRCQEIHQPGELGDTDQRRTESWLQTRRQPSRQYGCFLLARDYRSSATRWGSWGYLIMSLMLIGYYMFRLLICVNLWFGSRSLWREITVLHTHNLPRYTHLERNGKHQGNMRGEKGDRSRMLGCWPSGCQCGCHCVCHFWQQWRMNTCEDLDKHCLARLFLHRQPYVVCDLWVNLTPSHNSQDRLFISTGKTKGTQKLI